ncbi:hypothetical protein U9911_15420, partial [Escherichia coli]
WKGWAISHRQKQKKLIMLPSETMIWQPEFTDKTLSRKPGAVQRTQASVARAVVIQRKKTACHKVNSDARYVDIQRTPM